MYTNKMNINNKNYDNNNNNITPIRRPSMTPWRKSSKRSGSQGEKRPQSSFVSRVCLCTYIYIYIYV